MSKFIPAFRQTLLRLNNKHAQTGQVRLFLSNAYYCRENWESRMKSPLLQRVNLDELYHELDLSYQRNKNISAVDVDIFSNAVDSNIYIDELLDLVHKLRLSADAVNILDSTQHAVVRYLIAHEQYDQLLNILDDRLNYGIFLDAYTSNLLMDIFWKKTDYTAGARVASQMMLQEDFSNPLNAYLSALHCYNYLRNPTGWPEPAVVDNTEEEVKVRVKFLRNPYFDNHFDLVSPQQIVGKTLLLSTSAMKGTLCNTLQVLGAALYQDHDKVKKIVSKLSASGDKIYSESLQFIPEDNASRAEALKLQTEDGDVGSLLEAGVREHERLCSESDIAEQCKSFDSWEEVRKDALEQQKKRLITQQRLAAVEESQKKLKEKEMKLWFFDREEQLELDIDAKRVFYPKRWFGKKKIPRKVDENYVPPEVHTKYSKEK